MARIKHNPDNNINLPETSDTNNTNILLIYNEGRICFLQ